MMGSVSLKMEGSTDELNCVITEVVEKEGFPVHFIEFSVMDDDGKCGVLRITLHDPKTVLVHDGDDDRFPRVV